MGESWAVKRAKSKKEEQGLPLGVVRFQDVPYLQILKPQNQLFLSSSRHKNQVQSGVKKWVQEQPPMHWPASGATRPKCGPVPNSEGTDAPSVLPRHKSWV